MRPVLAACAALVLLSFLTGCIERSAPAAAEGPVGGCPVNERYIGVRVAYVYSKVNLTPEDVARFLASRNLTLIGEGTAPFHLRGSGEWSHGWEFTGLGDDAPVGFATGRSPSKDGPLSSLSVTLQLNAPHAPIAEAAQTEAADRARLREHAAPLRAALEDWLGAPVDVVEDRLTNGQLCAASTR